MRLVSSRRGRTVVVSVALQFKLKFIGAQAQQRADRQTEIPPEANRHKNDHSGQTNIIITWTQNGGTNKD